MNQLASVFESVVTLGVRALPVMAVVLAARWLLRRFCRQVFVGLWLLVALRLLVPADYLTPAPWSVENLTPVQTVTAFTQTTITPGKTLLPAEWEPGLSAELPAAVQPAAGGGLQVEEGLALLWLTGMAGLALYGGVSYLRLRRRLATAVRREGNVYECDGLTSPFVLGWLRPRIYLPFRLDDRQRTYVLCHEREHLRWGDPWWKLLAFGLWTVYWWNPAVWLCYGLFCRDLEMRCDEAVLRQLGSGAKEGYSLSLVDFAVARRWPTPSPLTFGEGDARRRVRHVLNWKRATGPVTFLAFTLTLVVTLICTTTADNRSWVQLEQGASGLGVRFNCRLEEPIQSWAIYEDVYQDGVLLSSGPRIFDGFAENGDYATSRTFSGALNAAPVYDQDGGFTGTLQMSASGTGAFAWEVRLPEPHYTGCGGFSGELSAGKRLESLGRRDEQILLTVEFSTKPNGELCSDVLTNDTVVQFRLVVSDDAPEAFSSVSDADRLFALKNPYVGDVSADVAVLKALGVGGLGNYTLELFTAAPPYILQLNFTEEPQQADTLDTEMGRCAMKLLALIDNLDQVRWTYPADGKSVARSFDTENAGAVLALSSSRVTLRPDSAEDLDRLLHFADVIDGKLFRMLAQTTGETGDQPLPASLSLLETMETAVWFAPEEIHDIQSAQLVELDGTVHELTATNGARALEKQLSMAQPISMGGTGCPFHGVLYLRRSDGVVGKVLPAEDSCAVFQSDGQFYDFGDNNDGLYALFGLTPEQLDQDRGTVRTPFTDILGYDGEAETTETDSGWSTTTYYGRQSDGKLTPVAVSFGFPDDADMAPRCWSVDLDGDGQKEFVCNVTYGGDGARRVRVYQRRGEEIWMGSPTTRGLPSDFNNWGANATWSEYVPEEQVFRLHYAVKGQEEAAVREIRGLEQLSFERWEG